MPDSDFDAIGFEEGWDGGDIGLAVVVREQHLGFKLTIVEQQINPMVVSQLVIMNLMPFVSE